MNDRNETVAEIDPLLSETHIFNVNTEVLGLTPSVSIATSMLSLAAGFGREQISASNQLQLSAMTTMLELARTYGELGRRTSPAVTEALDLAKQVVAARAP
jgi:hypothetical protein